jgi:hypothetical protein
MLFVTTHISSLSDSSASLAVTLLSIYFYSSSQNMEVTENERGITDKRANRNMEEHRMLK